MVTAGELLGLEGGLGDAKIQFMFQRCNETLGRQVGIRLSTV